MWRRLSKSVRSGIWDQHSFRRYFLYSKRSPGWQSKAECVVVATDAELSFRRTYGDLTVEFLPLEKLAARLAAV